MAALTQMTGDERSARIALAAIAGPGDPLSGRVLTTVGALETLRLLEDEDPIPGLDRVETGLWRTRQRPRIDADRIEQALDRTDKSGLRTLIPDDEHYPPGLADLGHRAPYILWASGDTQLLQSFAQTFTITGTHNSTAYGRQMASELAVDLVDDWGVVVAGGASGIDAAVHETALRNDGRTIAVIPGGIDVRGGDSNAQTLDEIAAQGLLLSESPPGEGGHDADRILARLRIEAALSGSVTLVEADDRSAAAAVVDRARELGRPVGAIPGPVTSPASEVPNELIRDGAAQAVLGASDVLSIHYPAPQPRQRPGPEPPTPPRAGPPHHGWGL